MRRFNLKNEENMSSDANKKGKGFRSGKKFGGKLFLGQAKHSARYRSSSIGGKGTRGNNF